MIYSKNPHVAQLLLHSYGQGGSVALPNSKDEPEKPRKTFPAGVQNVLDRLGDQYANWPSSNPRGTNVEWCFLVGGPGNGKTEALRVLADALKVKLPPKQSGQPVPRTVPEAWPTSAAFVVPGLEVVFINDASIPRPDVLTRGLPSLFLDLMDGLSRLVNHETPVVICANVNRGILIEEAAALERGGQAILSSDVGKLVEEMIRWLLSPTAQSLQDGASTLQTIIPIDPRQSHYGQFRVPLSVLGSHHDIIVHVVFLDTLSLLEPLPGGGKAIDFSTSTPKVAEYQTFGGFSEDRGASRERTVAGELLTDLVNISNWEEGGCLDPQGKVLCTAFDLCPFVQNTKWLRTLNLQRHFLDTLRAVEIAATRRLTYRDLWGHLSLAILGELEEDWLRGSHPCEWVKREKEAIDPEASKKAVAELVSHRIYMNLFPSPDPTAWRSERERPRQGTDTLYAIAIKNMTSMNESKNEQAFERAFNYIDPARDVDSWKGLREKVVDSVESLEIEPPFKQVLDGNFLPQEAHSKIEEVLDQVIQDEIAEELTRSSRPDMELPKAPARRAKLLRKWRNILLLRQVGLANGKMAFRETLMAWLAEQYNALRKSNLLELGQGIEALILPRSSTGQFLIAPLRPRTYSLKEDALPKNALLVAIHPDDLRVEIVPKGDMLAAEILQTVRGSRKSPEVVASIVVDLAIAREATLQAGGGSASFTEIGSSAFARIERVRASLVGRERLKQASIYFTDEQGRPYLITDNPAGPAPLRILSQERNT